MLNACERTPAPHLAEGRIHTWRAASLFEAPSELQPARSTAGAAAAAAGPPGARRASSFLLLALANTIPARQSPCGRR
eukprot:263868-Chlamydomonas_euryale.AAC.1